jgi:hypothetical protein
MRKDNQNQEHLNSLKDKAKRKTILYLLISPNRNINKIPAKKKMKSHKLRHLIKRQNLII